MVSAVCQGLLSCRRHIGKREDPGDEVAPKPDADLRMPVDLPLDKKTVENQDWATGPPGNGPRAVGRGPLGLRAAGPLGRRGPWAAGQLLARPMQPVQSRISSQWKPWRRERNRCGKVAVIRGFYSTILKTIYTRSLPLEFQN